MHRLLVLFNGANNDEQRDRAINQIWCEHGDYFQRCLFKWAYKIDKNGGTERGFHQAAIYEYRTGGDQAADVSGFEGVMDHTMAATNLIIRKADDREGMLEAELRSAAFHLFLKAAKKFDQKRGVPFRGYYWKIAKYAVIDVKRKLPAGLTGKSEVAEPKHNEPCHYELEAMAVAGRILQARSEAYVLRWCNRDDVDAIDGDIVHLHLIRPALCDGKRPPFHSLEDIATRHGISKQAVAKRRKLIVTDLLGRGSKRSSDNLTPQEPTAIWLSVSDGHRICFEGGGERSHQTSSARLSVYGDASTCFEGENQPATPIDLIEAYEQALEAFAAGTRFNLYWREMPKVFGRVDQSIQRLAAIAGTPESVYETLSDSGREALHDMWRIQEELAITDYGKRNRPHKPNLPSFHQSTGYTHLGPRPGLVPGPILQLRARMRREIGPFNPAYPPAIPELQRGSFCLAHNLMVTRPLGVCLNYHCRSQLAEQGSTLVRNVTNA